MAKPRFCFTYGGYREQAKNLSDEDIADFLRSYRDDLGPFKDFIFSLGGEPKDFTAFSDELLERQKKRTLEEKSTQ